MGGITQIIFSTIGSLLYPIFSIFFLIIDLVQNIFFAFAGLGSVTVGGRNFGIGGTPVDNSGDGGDTQNGIVYYLFRTETAKNILISMAILGVFLLIIFTVMAFIKNMYAAKQKKWQEIISSAIKGLINFLFIPVCCLLGVIAGNFLLQALNEATAGSSDVAMGRQLFVSSSYNGNLFRDQWDGDAEDVANLQALYKETFGRDLNLQNVNDPAVYADYLDEIFKSNKGPEIYSWWSVNKWYHLWSINYLMIAAGGIFLLFALIKISFGALKRLFMLVMLFVISPAVCSLYPLDDGSAVGKWRSEFLKQFFSVYGAVIGLNLFFDLVPLINSIQLGGSGVAWGDPLGLIPLFVTIAGLYMVSDFINLVQGLIPGAGESALQAGSSLSGQVKGGFKKGAKYAVGTGMAVTGAFVKAGAYARDRSKAINDAVADKNKEVGLKSRRDFEDGRKGRKEWKDYKKAHETDFEAQKLPMKEAKKKAKEDVGSATGGFFRSLGGDILKGTGNIVTNLSDNFGLGKPGDWASSIRGSNKSGHDRYKTETDSRKIISDMGKADGLKDVVKIVEGKNGDVLYDKIKDNDKFKNAAKAAGITDLSSRDAFLTQAKAQVRAKDDAVAYEAAQQKYYDAYDPEVIANKLKEALEKHLQELESKGKDTSNWTEDNKATALSQLQRGEKLNLNPDIASVDDIHIANMMNGELDNVSANQNRAKGELQVLSTKALESAKTVSENTTDPELSESLNEYMGGLQDVLSRLDNGQEIHNMGDKLSDKLQKLLEKQENLSKVIKQTSANEGREIAKAIKDAAKDKNKKGS